MTEQTLQERPCIDQERDIRIAIWNTCRWQGKPQEVAQSFIRHVMEEPCMVRVLDTLDAKDAEIADLRGALQSLVEIAQEADIGMMDEQIAAATHALAKGEE